MRKGKILQVIFIMLLSLFILGGCGSQDQDETEQNEVDQNDSDQIADNTNEENVQEDEISGYLTIWEHGTSFEEPLDDVIAGFQEKYPNIEIDYEIKDSTTYYSLLTTAVTSGDPPDIFWTNGTATSTMKDLVDNDALLELTDIVDFTPLNSESFSLAEINGEMYSVPWMVFDTRANYYNKTIFDEEGWSIPTTFTEYEELLEKQKNAGYIPISLCPNDSWPILFAFEPVLAAYDYEYVESLNDYSVKATDEPASGALTKMKEWADKGYFGENYLGVTDGDSQILAFTTGNAAMTIAGSWEISTIQNNNPDLDFGAFQIPSEDGTKGMTGTFANGFSVYKDTPNLEAAKAFVQYCATIDAQSKWVQAMGAVPGSAEIESTNEIANEMSDVDKTYISWQSVLANYAKEGESATSIWEENVSKVFYDVMTADELMNDISEVMK